MPRKKSSELDENPGLDIGKVEVRNVEDEMRRSYLDYAMSVIVSRALPDLRDGLKPSQRRILVAMRDLNLTHRAKHRKCAKIAGDTSGNYHPHGEQVIYPTLVHMAQNFAMRYPLVDGQGNFGSIDGDEAAAMRYCVTGESLVITDQGLEHIGKLGQAGSEELARTVLSVSGKENPASKWFDSGIHQTKRVTTRHGYTVAGTGNHPLLVLMRDDQGIRLRWKLIGQIQTGDHLVIDRSEKLWPTEEVDIQTLYPVVATKSGWQRHVLPCTMTKDLAFLLGALLSEGTFQAKRFEFTNTHGDFADAFQTAWKRAFPSCRLHVFDRLPVSYGKLPFWQMQVVSQELVAFMKNLGLSGKSAEREIPEVILQSPKRVVAAFLRGLFEGDGAVERSGRSLLRIGYWAKNEHMLRDLQILLLRFGIVSSRRKEERGDMSRLLIVGQENLRRFETSIGFASRTRQVALCQALATYGGKALSKSDYIPYMADYVRGVAEEHQVWLRKHNFDRLERLPKAVTLLHQALPPTDHPGVDYLAEQGYLFDPVAAVEDAGEQNVYSLRVDSACHSFVANGFVNHNTEARLTAVAEEMLLDLDKETVDWMPNYDATRQEPKVLPSKVPQLLMNGSVGIAVGMATNIPPHNLGELCDGLMFMTDKPEAEIDELLEFVKGPDFPTAGIIYNTDDIRGAYATGRGKIVIRGRAEIEEGRRGSQIVITEIPFAVNKSTLVEKIANLVKEKRIEGISDLRDESDRKGIRVVVELKQNAYGNKILNQLYELTQLQSAFYVNMLALTKDLEPRILNLKEMMIKFLEFRFEVVTRRTEYELKRAEERAHILEGLKIALDHIDEVISTIRGSANRDVAKKNLIVKFKLSEIQATAILEMRLAALAALERQRVEDELKEKLALIAELKAILADPNRIRGIMKDEFLDIKERFGDERRTEIRAEGLGKFSAEDLIPDEEVVVTLTQSNYIKRLPVATFRAQGRGGKGVVGMGTKAEDIVQELLTCRTHDDILFFTNRGRLFQTKVFELPSTSRQAKGQALVNLISIAPDEKVTAIITLDKDGRDKRKYFVMATELGVIKKTEIEAYKNVRKSGIVAIRLQPTDQLKWVKASGGKDDVFMVSAKGQAILFNEKDARPLGRSTAGVRGMKLRSDDLVMSMDVVPDGLAGETDALVILQNGFGKRARLGLFSSQGRGGIGVKVANVTTKTGQIIGMHLVRGEQADVLFVSKEGQVLRTPIKTIKRLGRDTQGVTIMRLNKQDKVASVAVMEPELEGDLLEETDEPEVTEEKVKKTVPTRQKQPVSAEAPAESPKLQVNRYRDDVKTDDE